MTTENENVTFDEQYQGAQSEETAVEYDGNQSEETGEDSFAVFGGEEVKVSPRRKDAHEAKILGVTRKDTDNGSTAMTVHFQSTNTGQTFDQNIFFPKPFVEETGAFLRREKGLEDLQPGYPDPDRPGKLKGNERAQYGMAYKNSAGDAAFQLLLGVASKASRSVPKGTKIETFDELIEVSNTLLQDLDVIVSRTPGSVSEENPRGFLNVNRVYDPEVKENPKFLKDYLKHWEEGQGIVG